MTFEPQRPSGARDNLLPPDPSTTVESSTGSRRQFFAQVTQVGARLVAGLSLLQAAPGRSEAAPVTGIANTPPNEAEIAADVERLRTNLEQPLGSARFVTTYVYDIQGKLMRR